MMNGFAGIKGPLTIILFFGIMERNCEMDKSKQQPKKEKS
jgi:hypothetical protein